MLVRRLFPLRTVPLPRVARFLAASLVVWFVSAQRGTAEESYVAPWMTDGEWMEVVPISGDIEVRDGVIHFGPKRAVVMTHVPHRHVVLEGDWRLTRPLDVTVETAAVRGGRSPVRGTLSERIEPAAEGRLSGWRFEHGKVPARLDRLPQQPPSSPAFPAADRPFWIRLRIDPHGAVAALHHAKIRELGFRALFDGKSLDGWEPADPNRPDDWGVEEGNVVCRGKAGTWLRSTAEYGNFELRFQYRLPPGGNSGVYVRVPGDGAHHGTGAGVEIQVLDDAAPKHQKLKPYQYTGSVYAIAPAWPRVGHPPGHWNAMAIRVVGTRYRIYHNGRLVVDADGIRYPQLFERRRKGVLGLQNHRSPVAYRHVRLKPLPSPTPAERPRSSNSP